MNKESYKKRLKKHLDKLESTNSTPVVKPSLPNLDDFIKFLPMIWDRKVLTNSGPIEQFFEKLLSEKLGVSNVSMVSNCSVGLQLAINALNVKEEVITTPFTFPATVNALYWNKICPIFCDINPSTLNIDEDKIESLITPKTTAILAVHMFGRPCNTSKIDEIASKYNIKVIYDCAHCFDVLYKGRSLCSYGDASVLSFHATKQFHTFEGGAIVFQNQSLKRKCESLKNNGIINKTQLWTQGTNAKATEIQSLLGVLMLDTIKDDISKRKTLFKVYKEKLKGLQGIELFKLSNPNTHNYLYFPIRINHLCEISREELISLLNSHSIFPRPYFNYLSSHFSDYQVLKSASKTNLKYAEEASKEILCLPLYTDLHLNKVEFICDLIIRFLGNDR